MRVKRIDHLRVFLKQRRWIFIFWFFFFWYGYITDKINEPETHIISSIIFFVTHILFLFYGYLFIFKHIAEKKLSIFEASGILLLFIGLFLPFRYFVRFYLIPVFNIPEPASLNVKIHLINSSIWIIDYFFYAAGYFYFANYLSKERQRRHAVEQQLQTEQALNVKEQERLQLENIALRAQINPHFLFNTLGFLYSKALPYSEELSDGIMRLSEIMQFSIKPNDGTGLVLLNDELEHIENILAINKLRFNKSIYLDFTCEGDFSGVKIVPLVLLTLAENVLKHAQLNKPEHPACMHLALQANRLSFVTHNKKRIGPKEHSTSIGLNNTRKRLASTYGQNFSLTVKENGDYFTTTLIVDNIRHTM